MNCWSLVVDAMQRTAPGATVCLIGLSPSLGRVREAPPGREIHVLGSVNANHRHFRDAAEALARADREWLEGLITRRVPLDRWPEALERRPDDIKPVIEFGVRS